MEEGVEGNRTEPNLTQSKGREVEMEMEMEMEVEVEEGGR